MIETPLHRLEAQLSELAQKLEGLTMPLTNEVVKSALVTCVRSIAALARLFAEAQKKEMH